MTTMGSLKLEGETLGQKHQHYNKLLNDVISTNMSQEITKIDYNEPDIDNLFKIDIASKRKNIDYILEVLKCEDMLYVSRALKQSVWLITDIKYADIINPDYLNTQLFPQMTSKAGHKLILTIRLNLKNENRVELFYKYYEEKNDFKTALKWLPNCSISHIENVVEKRATEMPHNVIKRLCEKSFTVIEICARKYNDNVYAVLRLLSETMFLLNNNAEKFVNFMNSLEEYCIPKLSPKATQIIMNSRPDIILDNFKKFATKINIPTFVKFLKREEIQDFLMKHIEDDNLKSWFTFETMKHFIYYMPSASRFDFIRRVCINKDHESFERITYDTEYLCKNYAPCSPLKSMPQSSNAHIYKWYKFAPFSIAFTDLMKLIRVESNPSERNEIFAVLLTCAKSDPENLHQVLLYYREKHINEPFKFKNHFVNIVLSLSISLKFEDKIWTILNDIIYSMEVYNENKNNMQSCVKYIIVYKVIHDTNVPDIVEEKFEFDTLKSLQSKLNDEEKDKIFNYLYQFIITKILNITIDNESDFDLVIVYIINVLNLLNDWKKDIAHYDVVLEKIREIVRIKNNKSWNTDLSAIYNVNKSWRKHMFKESLFLRPTQETCINAIKHGPEILLRCEKNICSNDSIILTRLLKKLRIYWHQTLATVFEDTFKSQLNNKAKHKLSVRGLCVLLPRKQLTDILSNYKPSDTKINWTEADDVTLSIQKYFAKYMLLARPHPPVDIVLLYAKGDYLQFVLPSVLSILFNISSKQSLKYMPTLLESPVSLQKHGLRIAFTKLNVDELLSASLSIWKSTKNSSIRATIFKLVFDLLCKEQIENKIMEIWRVLDTFIDNLTPDENRIIYITLGNASKVPLSVRQAYCMKSYRFLKSLPPKSNCDKFSESIILSTVDIMESIDVEYIAEVIFDLIDKKNYKQYYAYKFVISSCLLSTKSESIQTQRYEKVFVPLLQKYLSFLKNPEQKLLNVKYNFNNTLQQLLQDLKNITIHNNMLTPTKLFNDIHNDLENNLSSEDYYVLLTTWNLAAKFVQLVAKYRDESANMPIKNQRENESDNSSMIYSKAAPEFGKVCMEKLKKEIKRYYPSIFRLFSKALRQVFNKFGFNSKIELAILKVIQEHADTVEGHLLVLKLLPYCGIGDNEKEELDEICEVLSSHPSAEVRMPYQHMLRKKARDGEYVYY